MDYRNAQYFAFHSETFDSYKGCEISNCLGYKQDKGEFGKIWNEIL